VGPVVGRRARAAVAEFAEVVGLPDRPSRADTVGSVGTASVVSPVSGGTVHSSRWTNGEQVGVAGDTPAEPLVQPGGVLAPGREAVERADERLAAAAGAVLGRAGAVDAPR